MPPRFKNLLQASSTLLLSTGEELKTVAESDFLQDVRTVWAGNVGPHRHIVQVTSKHMVLLNNLKKVHQIKCPKKRRFRICSAAGSYILALLDDHAMAVRQANKREAGLSVVIGLRQANERCGAVDCHWLLAVERYLFFAFLSPL